MSIVALALIAWSATGADAAPSASSYNASPGSSSALLPLTPEELANQSSQSGLQLPDKKRNLNKIPGSRVEPGIPNSRAGSRLDNRVDNRVPDTTGEKSSLVESVFPQKKGDEAAPPSGRLNKPNTPGLSTDVLSKQDKPPSVDDSLRANTPAKAAADQKSTARALADYMNRTREDRKMSEPVEDLTGGFSSTDALGNRFTVAPTGKGAYEATDTFGNRTRIEQNASGGYDAVDSLGNRNVLSNDELQKRWPGAGSSSWPGATQPKK